MSAAQAVSHENSFAERVVAFAAAKGTLSSAGPLRYLLVEETIPDRESHFLQWAHLPRRGSPCPVACFMHGMLRHEHGLRDIIRDIVEVVLPRDLICMNSDLMVGNIERHSVEELSTALNLRQHGDERLDG